MDSRPDANDGLEFSCVEAQVRRSEPSAKISKVVMCSSPPLACRAAAGPYPKPRRRASGWADCLLPTRLRHVRVASFSVSCLRVKTQGGSKRLETWIRYDSRWRRLSGRSLTERRDNVHVNVDGSDGIVIPPRMSCRTPVSGSKFGEGVRHEIILPPAVKLSCPTSRARSTPLAYLNGEEGFLREAAMTYEGQVT